MRKTLKVKFLRHQVPVFDCTARNVVYVKGRRAGGTLGAVNRLIELAHTRRGSRHLWIDTVHRNIERYVQRYFIPRLGGTNYKWNRGRKCLRFQGGAYCDFASAQRPENLEGFAYDYFWFNEAGIILRNEDLYFHTLLPMAAESRGGQSFFIGTPKGSGLFKRMFDWGQEAGRPDWKSFRSTSLENFTLNKGELRRFKREMSNPEYRQEILAEFIEGEGAVFRGVEQVAKAQQEKLGNPAGSYVLGVDLARYRDFTVIWVGRADTGTGVYCERFRRLPWRRQVERISDLSRRFGDAPIYVDATGVGDPVAETLSGNGLPVVAVVLTAARKQQLIEGLALAIEQELFTFFPHKETLKELSDYQYSRLSSGTWRTSAPAGSNDDCVIALALCRWESAAVTVDRTLGPEDFLLENFSLEESPIGSTLHEQQLAREVTVEFGFHFQHGKYEKNLRAFPGNTAMCNSIDAAGVKNGVTKKSEYILASDTASLYLANLVRKHCQGNEFVSFAGGPNLFDLELADVVRVQHPMIVGSEALYQIIRAELNPLEGRAAFTAAKLIAYEA